MEFQRDFIVLIDSKSIWDGYAYYFKSSQNFNIIGKYFAVIVSKVFKVLKIAIKVLVSCLDCVSHDLYWIAVNMNMNMSIWR